MKVSKEERAVLSDLAQQEFTNMRLAKRVEKASRKHKEEKRSFIHSLAFWKWIGRRSSRKEESAGTTESPANAVSQTLAHTERKPNPAALSSADVSKQAAAGGGASK
jgi:hypothetical protein